MDILHQYKNGNCLVTLYNDGSKTREWEGEALPLFPESCDIKISDYCDANCAYCHEESTTAGKPCKVDDFAHLINKLPAGVELAIGGGDPLSHPNFADLIGLAKKEGLVCNITVNAVHIARYAEQINRLRENRDIYGLGISWNKSKERNIAEIGDKNTVLHVIMGVHSPYDIMRVRQKKILILGYKTYGRGIKYHNQKVVDNIKLWNYWFERLCRLKHISLDNLAIEQLRIKERILPELWAERYMGDDGKFTMYVDAVSMKYGASSTKDRIPLGGMTIREAFSVLS